eukprot:CAMPEP_0119208472 /NCGR_PEP_ID=MMETSP1327-20130426/670_1 /TAXON_ID=38833 /ORGANISM="Micromonas pusilla, Strain RCC2306" /LENGTH=58 /DNA_ID=CAMNT_0007205007 /DNA_START=716 /DNA_END=892 /DNA_ORIENTATION=+
MYAGCMQSSVSVGTVFPLAAVNTAEATALSKSKKCRNELEHMYEPSTSLLAMCVRTDR